MSHVKDMLVPVPPIEPLTLDTASIESDHWPLLGAFIGNNAEYAWMAKGPFIQVIQRTNGHKIGAWRFGWVVREQTVGITCVDEIRIKDKNSCLLIGLEYGLNSLICVFDFVASRVLRAIIIPAKVTCLHVICTATKNIAGPLMFFDGIAAIGTQGGKLFILDLCLERCFEALNVENLLEVRDEMYPCETLILHRDEIENFNWVNFMESAAAKSSHIVIQLNGKDDSPHFILKGPKGDNRILVNRQEAEVSSIFFCSQFDGLLVGYNFGAMQMYNLLQLRLTYTSSICEEHIPITHFAVQEPADDPRAFYFVWAVYGCKDFADCLPLAVMYAFSFKCKEMQTNGIYKFIDFQYAAVQFQMELGFLNENFDEEIVHMGGKCLNVYALMGPTNESLDHTDTVDDRARLCVFMWSVAVCDKHAIEKKYLTYVGIFDLNQWYKEQMPVEQSRTNSSYYNQVSVDMDLQRILEQNHCDASLYSAPIFCVQIYDDSVQEFHWSKRHDEHDWPNSLSYDLYILSSSYMGVIRHLGVQQTLLERVREAGPLCLLEPNDIYHQFVNLAVIPALLPDKVEFDCFTDGDVVATDCHQQRRFILNVVLQSGMLQWLCKCAQTWSNGSYLSVGCSMDLLLIWALERAVALKQYADSICTCLFDHTQLSGLDAKGVERLNQTKKQLSHLCSMYEFVLAFNLYPPDTLIEPFDQLKCLVQYFNVILWMIHSCLLPELPIASYPSKNEKDRPLIPYLMKSIRQEILVKRSNCVDFNQQQFQRKDSFLFIDNLIEVECGGSVLRRQWLEDAQDEDDSYELYPPPSLQSVLRSYLLLNIEVDVKHTFFMYVLQDIIYALKGNRYETTQLEKFPVVFKLPKAISLISKSFWYLDHGHCQDAMKILLDPALLLTQDMKYWHHRIVLKSLLMHEEMNLAWRYIQTRRPPIVHVDDAMATISLYVSQRMLNEAFLLHRQWMDSPNSMKYLLKECHRYGTFKELAMCQLNKHQKNELINFIACLQLNSDADDMRELFELLRDEEPLPSDTDNYTAGNESMDCSIFVMEDVGQLEHNGAIADQTSSFCVQSTYKSNVNTVDASRPVRIPYKSDATFTIDKEHTKQVVPILTETISNCVIPMGQSLKRSSVQYEDFETPSKKRRMSSALDDHPITALSKSLISTPMVKRKSFSQSTTADVQATSTPYHGILKVRETTPQCQRILRRTTPSPGVRFRLDNDRQENAVSRGEMEIIPIDERPEEILDNVDMASNIDCETDDLCPEQRKSPHPNFIPQDEKVVSSHPESNDMDGLGEEANPTRLIPFSPRSRRSIRTTPSNPATTPRSTSVRSSLRLANSKSKLSKIFDNEEEPAACSGTPTAPPSVFTPCGRKSLLRPQNIKHTYAETNDTDKDVLRLSSVSEPSLVSHSLWDLVNNGRSTADSCDISKCDEFTDMDAAIDDECAAEQCSDQIRVPDQDNINTTSANVVINTDNQSDLSDGRGAPDMGRTFCREMPLPLEQPDETALSPSRKLRRSPCRKSLHRQVLENNAENFNMIIDSPQLSLPSEAVSMSSSFWELALNSQSTAPSSHVSTLNESADVSASDDERLVTADVVNELIVTCETNIVPSTRMIVNVPIESEAPTSIRSVIASTPCGVSAAQQSIDTKDDVLPNTPVRSSLRLSQKKSLQSDDNNMAENINIDNTQSPARKRLFIPDARHSTNNQFSEQTDLDASLDVELCEEIFKPTTLRPSVWEFVKDDQSSEDHSSDIDLSKSSARVTCDDREHKNRVLVDVELGENTATSLTRVQGFNDLLPQQLSPFVVKEVENAVHGSRTIFTAYDNVANDENSGSNTSHSIKPSSTSFVNSSNLNEILASEDTNASKKSHATMLADNPIISISDSSSSFLSANNEAIILVSSDLSHSDENDLDNKIHASVEQMEFHIYCDSNETSNPCEKVILEENVSISLIDNHTKLTENCQSLITNRVDNNVSNHLIRESSNLSPLKQEVSSLRSNQSMETNESQLNPVHLPIDMDESTWSEALDRALNAAYKASSSTDVITADGNDKEKDQAVASVSDSNLSLGEIIDRALQPRINANKKSTTTEEITLQTSDNLVSIEADSKPGVHNNCNNKRANTERRSHKQEKVSRLDPRLNSNNVLISKAETPATIAVGSDAKEKISSTLTRQNKRDIRSKHTSKSSSDAVCTQQTKRNYDKFEANKVLKESEENVFCEETTNLKAAINETVRDSKHTLPLKLTRSRLRQLPPDSILPTVKEETSKSNRRRQRSKSSDDAQCLSRVPFVLLERTILPDELLENFYSRKAEDDKPNNTSIASTQRRKLRARSVDSTLQSTAPVRTRLHSNFRSVLGEIIEEDDGTDTVETKPAIHERPMTRSRAKSLSAEKEVPVRNTRRKRATSFTIDLNPISEVSAGPSVRKSLSAKGQVAKK